ncbi:type VI secretion system protein TssA [Halopseudomonas salegens]|uniref:Type VI secretion system protein ImpA n=1 Tax=Halopseudomonas salegens TaxID=1434072 RepID=A0A1H2E0A6_9GAMM|nr:type VI secretion system protein TssA [Halopseudomonas salegens]SDT88546.1 type VI secretion system protein ImpA [Halopseudomonas salegens]
MSIDISILLEPVSVDNPAGAELDYDQEFVSLVTEMQGKPEQQYGETLIHAVEPDWTLVSREAQALLKKSKDFRLAVMITRALTRTEGVAGAVLGVELLLALTEHYWANGFPALEFEGEADPLLRSNALTELTANNGLIKDLRERIIHSRTLGNIALGSLERIQQSREAVDDIPLSRDNVTTFLQDELKDGNPDIAALPTLHKLTNTLKERIQCQLGAEYAPDFGALCSFLDCFLRPELAAEESPQAPEAPAVSQGPASNGVAHASGRLGRQDAISMLDAVCAYLEECEPANPAPLLIRRARNMIGQDFVSILRDIAPDGLHQVEMITGISARE